MSDAPLVILGCGFLGRTAAKLALERGRTVIATVRSEQSAIALRATGIDARVHPHLDTRIVRSLAEAPDLLVTFPPDGDLDAKLTFSPRRAVYVSSTGVYGEARGDVDETTPVDLRLPRAAERFAAERHWRDRGATVLRAAGIYGPGRGIHLRIANGTFRIMGDGSNVVSRIHVHDLATLVLAALDRSDAGSMYVAADDTPVPQIEAVRFLCDVLERPLPPSIALADVGGALRHDRCVRNARARSDLQWAPRFAGYREGFVDAIRADGLHLREG